MCRAFAQLTYRESLRDIEPVCAPNAPSFITSGFGRRSHATRWQCERGARLAHLADFAQSLIAIARPLYANEPFGVDLKESVYALMFVD